MKKFKKVAALVTVMALGASAVVGCSAGGGEKKEGGSPAGSAQTVGFSVSTLNNPFFVTLSDGAKNAAKEKGIQLTVVDAGDDSAKQISDIEDLISKNIKVLIVNPVDSDAVASAVESATKKGIKVIAVDRAVNGAEVECQIASDNVAGARMAAEYLKELVGDGAKVAELEGVPGASAAIDRGQGFHEVADKDLKVVSSQTANFNRAEGLSVMENILQADGDIKGVFAHNDEMALGAVEAIASTGKDIKVVGFDATDDARKAVEDGTMAATVAQQPELMGKTAVETAISIMEGKSVEKSIPVEVTLIKK
ncbi:ABC-type sugar transport system, periplasmic component [Clostridium sp. ASBs410]|nr:ABC-type sugar transport system, periplasmic component [Clostridium sp. ASBs410]